MVFCSKCGAPVQDGLAFCSKCGQPVAAAQPAPPQYQAPSAQPPVQYQAPGAPSAAQLQGKQAIEILQKGLGAILSRMGLLALIGTLVVWISWFFLPGFTISVPLLGTTQGSSSTLWSALSLDPANNMAAGSFGFLAFVVFICIVLLPFAAAFIPHPLAKFLYGAPLFAWLIGWGTVEYEFSHMLSLVKQQLGADVTGLLSLSTGFGAYLALLASLAVAARIVMSPAVQSAPRVAAPPAARVAAPPPAYVAQPPVAYAPPPPPAAYAPAPAAAPASRFCTSCGKPQAAGTQFCTACGARLTS
jgi:hypothetical protein